MIVGFIRNFVSGLFGLKPSNEWLKDATKHKKAGNWEKAIDSLKRGYKKAKAERVTYSSSYYLRLPKYLYEAGRSDEAWAEYNKMLTNGFDDGELYPKSVYMAQSQIYGSMSGQLKKENKLFESAIYSAVSSLLWEKEMLEQGRASEVEVNSVIASIDKLLKKTCKNNERELFLSIVRSALCTPRSIGATELMRELQSLK